MPGERLDEIFGPAVAAEIRAEMHARGRDIAADAATSVIAAAARGHVALEQAVGPKLTDWIERTAAFHVGELAREHVPVEIAELIRSLFQ